MTLSPFLRNFLSVYGTLLGGSGIRFIYGIVLARLLGPTQYGNFVFGMAFYGALIIFANFGQSALLATRIKGRLVRAPIPGFHSFILTVICTMGTFLAGLILLGLSPRFTDLSVVLTFFLGAMIAKTIVGWGRYFSFAIEDASWVPRYEVAFRSGEAIVGTVALILGFNLLTVCVIHFLAWVMEAYSVCNLLHGRGGVHFSRKIRWQYLITLWKISLLYTTSFGFFHLFSLLGVLMVNFWEEEPASTGFFGVAMQLFGGLALLPMAFGVAVIPAIGRIRKQIEVSGLSQLASVIKMVIVGGGGLAICAQAYGTWIISKIFGSEYALAGEVFGLLAWGLGPYSVALILGQALNALDGRLMSACLATMMLVTHFMVFFVFSHLGGMVAGAISLVCGAFWGCLATMVAITPRLGIKEMGWWFVPVIGVMGIGSLMHIEPFSNVVFAPLYILSLVLLVWGSGSLKKEELVTIFTSLKPGR